MYPFDLESALAGARPGFELWLLTTCFMTFISISVFLSEMEIMMPCTVIEEFNKMT